MTLLDLKGMQDSWLEGLCSINAAETPNKWLHYKMEHEQANQ